MTSSKRSVKHLVKHFWNKCCVTQNFTKTLHDFKTKSKWNVSMKHGSLKKKCFVFVIYYKFFPGFTNSSKCCNLAQINSFALCKFHVKCNFDRAVWQLCMSTDESKILFSRSKRLNKTHISLKENVFSLIKRVKHLAEFTDFLLLEVLAIYLYLKVYPKYRTQR